VFDHKVLPKPMLTADLSLGRCHSLSAIRDL